MSLHPALSSHDGLFEVLKTWAEWGWLRELDRSLAQFFAELDPHAEPLLLLACALASHQLGHGHVCLDLRATLEDPDFALSMPPEGDIVQQAALLPSAILVGVDLAQWQQSCQASTVLFQDTGAPLVMRGSALYLRRYWDYEQRVAQRLASRLAFEPADEALAGQLDRLFNASTLGARTDWQKVACAMAAVGRFTLITGGPGTGKTTTVVRLLALLQERALQGGSPLRLSLAAPTGKAAARLTESIGGQIQSLPVSDQVKALIPHEVTTLHRLLGTRPGSRHFRHDASNPLPLDVLVIDEASMIDLEMMDALLEALPGHARLLLLGDKDQLASVEAGAVLGDLCSNAEQAGYRADTLALLEQLTEAPVHDAALQPGDDALDQRIVMLRHSRRFAGDSGIGLLAQAVNRGDAPGSRAIIQRAEPGLASLRLKHEHDSALERLALEGWGNAPGYRAYLQTLRDQRPAPDAQPEKWDAWAKEVLQAFDAFQILCAVRKGTWGVEAVNQRVAIALHRAGLLPSDTGWYEGRPVLVTRNDYSLGLMNGDIGVALLVPDAGQASQTRLRVVFARNDGSGELRYILPSRLSEVETVFAMTVHKSQGSEFNHCALLLPDALNPVLTKELLYTGITRAKNDFTLIESRESVFELTVVRKVQRRSGLRLALAEFMKAAN